jgi:ribosomal-protein-serine acetyltransferase
MSRFSARDGILIRPWVATDADALFEAVISSLPTLMQWLPWATPTYSYADAAEWIAHCQRACADDEEYHFGVFDPVSDELLGAVGLNHRIRAYRTANIGYWVADATRGHGVAVEAARQAARFGFETLGLQRIAILIQPENATSLRVAAKLGSAREGVARNGIVVAGRPHDAIVHSLVPGDMTADGVDASTAESHAMSS